jgi:hypothetical protein
LEPSGRILGGVDPSNRDLGDAASCEEDAGLVRDLQLQLHRLTLELADTKLSLEDATLGRSKDQANARRAAADAERLKGEVAEVRGEAMRHAVLVRELEAMKRKAGEQEEGFKRVSEILEGERREREAERRKHREVERESESHKASLKAAAEVLQVCEPTLKMHP